MTDQELIQAAREWREEYFLNGEHCVLLDALIERLSALQTETAELRAALSRVEAERDAAIADMMMAASGRCCQICVRDCAGCEEITACAAFEWRGAHGRCEHGE